MRQGSGLSCAVALSVLLLLGAEARADFINWAYSWSHSPTVVSADKGGTGGVSLTNQQGGMGSGNSDVVAAQITTFSAATVNTPDHFTNRNYSLVLQLTDLAAHKSGMLTFTGAFNGTLSLTSANIKNTFFGPLTQHLDLGGNLYTVTIGPYAAPGIPDATQTGSISAHVSVQPDHSPGGGGGGSPPPTHGAPEPSTLLLAGLGLSALGVIGWRRLTCPRHVTCESAA